MKRILLFCVYFGFVFSCFAQIISGKIQTENGNVISNVNVYLDGTKISAVSAYDGSFQLDVQGQKSGNLIFQKDNYETSIFPLNQAIGKSVKVIINPVKEIEEVVIIPFTDEAYRNYINYFLDQFIGLDRENVIIKNQKSLKFSYDKKNRFLKVKAPQTLIIENKNLGYVIQYNLINFQADFKQRNTSYLGTSFFKETSNKQIYLLNRMNAYEGSLMHFFRSLYKNELEKDGFIVNHAKRIKNPDYDVDGDSKNNSEFLIAILKTKMKESDFTKRKEGRLFLDFNDLLQVNYQKYYYKIKKGEIVKSSGVVSQSSFIHPEALEFEIFPEGICSEPDLLILEESFSSQKVSKMLPLDYQFGN